MSKAGLKEILLEGAAAAWMAGCVGLALMLLAPGLGILNPFPLASACAAGAALITHRALVVLRGPSDRLPAFEIPIIQIIEPEEVEEEVNELLLTEEMVRPSELLLTSGMAVLTSELLLTRAQMLKPPVEKRSDPLLLDDVLAELRPDSRVVQLFDPNRMPTPGELKTRIDRHLGAVSTGVSDEPQPDASQALYDALAELRRSLA